MLAVVGSGEYLPTMGDVDRQLIELFDTPPTVVCLPTAAGTEGDQMIDSWMQRGVDHFTSLGAATTAVRVWNRATADDTALADTIAAADFVYLSGGKPSYLHDTLQESRAWQAILQVTDRGGLLAGCSAGAMVQGDVFANVPRRRAGFGLWPGAHIIPHFDQIPSTVVSAIRLAVGKQHTLIGVNANSALVNIDGAYRVIGERVTIWTSTHRSEFGPGHVPAEALHR